MSKADAKKACENQVKPYVKACVNQVTLIAIETWKKITLERQRRENDRTWRREPRRLDEFHVCFLFILSGREVFVPITAKTSYAGLYQLARVALGIDKFPSKSLRLCYHVPWVPFPGDENDAICSRSDKTVIPSDRSRTIRAFAVHA